MEERLWRTGLGLDCWGLVVGRFLDLEGTVSVFPPLWLRHLSRGGERIGWWAGPFGGLGWWFSGRNRFVVGGLWRWNAVGVRDLLGGPRVYNRLTGSALFGG